MDAYYEPNRQILGVDEARDAILNQPVIGFEFVQGETEDEDFFILNFPGNVSVYANAPTVYAPIK